MELNALRAALRGISAYRELTGTAIMFNAATNAVREIDDQDYGEAKRILQRAQLQTEAMYIAQEEKENAQPDGGDAGQDGED